MFKKIFLSFIFVFSIFCAKNETKEEKWPMCEKWEDETYLYACEQIDFPNNITECGKSDFGHCCFYEIKTTGNEAITSCVTNPYPRYYGKENNKENVTALTVDDLIKEAEKQVKQAKEKLDYIYMLCPPEKNKKERGVKCGNGYALQEDGTCKVKPKPKPKPKQNPKEKKKTSKKKSLKLKGKFDKHKSIL